MFCARGDARDIIKYPLCVPGIAPGARARASSFKAMAEVDLKTGLEEPSAENADGSEKGLDAPHPPNNLRGMRLFSWEE